MFFECGSEILDRCINKLSVETRSIYCPQEQGRGQCTFVGNVALFIVSQVVIPPLNQSATHL